jgi:hypothetical protein
MISVYYTDGGAEKLVDFLIMRNLNSKRMGEKFIYL